MRILESYRHIYSSGIGGILNSDNALIVYSIVIFSLSFYEVMSLKTYASSCLSSPSFHKDEVLNISQNLYIKGIHGENMIFLKSAIEKGLRAQDRGVIDVINMAMKNYPYECEFFNKRIGYQRLFKDNEVENKKEKIPATIIKRGCLLNEGE